ncbi:hypothetical protein ACJMK2_012350 [Sinanodonta woodiana]|uniref:THAP-type domain-containing protein n=1 Tax=Sinanodonta woodiana TaxID=1069815 RepID=A0ABD3VA79_SINWO
MPSSQRYAVIGCSIKKKHIKDWHNEYCVLHKRKRIFCECICPIKLYPFPTEMKDYENRKKWISNISRTSPASKTIWTPKTEDMVCNKHFMHGCPTQENPDPNILMGHDKIKSKSTRRVLCKIEPKLEQQSLHKRKTSKVQSGTEFDNTENISMCQNLASSSNIHSRRDVEVQTETDMNVISDISVQTECHENTQKFDHIYSVPNCDTSRTKAKLINSRTQKLRKNNQKLRGSVEYRYLQSDKKSIRFYTGIHDKTTCYALYGFVSSDAENLRYWKGKKISQSVYKGHTTSLCKQRRDNKRMLSAKDELVLVLMKLRLGRKSEDLADRFNISEGLCSQIISTWVKFLSDQLRGLVQFPPKEVFMRNIPHSFKNEYANTRVIIDCTEIFIERPRDLYIQAMTWSDYKKPNTIKCIA